MLRQISLFSVIGVVGFLVDSAVLYALVIFFDLNPYGARLGSYLVAATTTWALNRNFTFRDQRSAHLHREWATFLVVNGVGGAINYLVYSSVIYYFSGSGLFPLLGVACGSLAGLVFNFSLSKTLVFRAKPTRDSSG